MKYIKMFDHLDNLKVGRPTKARYERLRNFIETKALAIRLDKLKVPNWYVEIFINCSQWNLPFIDRKITDIQKKELFLKTLIEKLEVKYGGKKLLWRLKSYEYFEVTGMIFKYTMSTITENERLIIKEKRKIAKEKYDKENEAFRRKHGNLFGNFFDFNNNKNYEILGLKKGATKIEIKKAYRKLCKEHHPDVGGNISKFREVNEAYKMLAN